MTIQDAVIVLVVCLPILTILIAAVYVVAKQAGWPNNKE